ncbi:hypothetical protein Tco_0980662 [Tanacetum coccineum]
MKKCFGPTGSYWHSIYRNPAAELCLISMDFPEQFQSGCVSGFGFGLLGYKITQLLMNKIEQPTVPFSGEARGLTFLCVSGKEEPRVEIKEKIRAALKLLTFLEEHVLIQFWSPRDVGKHQILTTLDQPFGLGVANEELCFYRRSSEHNAFPVDKDHEEIEEYTSPAARVYRQGLPEWTFDITHYKSKDFPQQDLAIRCKLHGYIALPVFDIARKSCLGVLELLVSSKLTNYARVVKQVHGALKFTHSFIAAHFKIVVILQKQRLTCPRVYVRPSSYVLNECEKIRDILKSVCDYHSLPLAQTWAVSPFTSFVSHDKKIKKSCSSFDTECIEKVCMSTVALPYYVKDNGMWEFMVEGRKRHMYKSQGVVGRALSFQGVYFCRDVNELNEAEYPYMRVSLHSVEGDDDYKIEATSEFVLGDTSSMDLSDISDSE